MPSPPSSRGLPQRSVQVLRGPGLHILSFFQEGDAVLVGMGHEPELKNGTRARIEQACQKSAVASCTWSVLPIFQAQGGSQYVEYFLFGRGRKWPREDAFLSWVGPVLLAPEAAARLTACESHHQQPPEATDSAWCLASCWVRERFLTPLGTRASKAKERAVGDELLGGGASAQDSGDDEASSVSSAEEEEAAERDGEAEGVTKKESNGPVPRAASRWKIRAMRQGLPSAAWMAVLSSCDPCRVVLAGPITFQAGLVLAVLKYNDTRFGLGSCPLVAFCAGCQRPACGEAWSPKRVKSWQATHLAYHTVDRALHAYAASRLAASQANHTSAVPVPVKPLKPVRHDALKRVSSDDGTKALALAASQGAPVASNADHPSTVPVTKIITLAGNTGASPALFGIPAGGEPEPDSDDPDGTNPSADMSQACLSKRNSRFLTKYQLKVQASSESTGNGLFAINPTAIGTELPVKGPWFRNREEVETFLQSLHAETASMLSTRVVRIFLKTPGQDAADPRFKVVTNPCGFINHFTRLNNQPNCQLKFKEGMPLGEHSLVVVSTKPIKAGKEWLLHYGPEHPCGQTLKRKRKPARRAS